MRKLWIGLKALLSLILLTVAAVLMVQFVQGADGTGPLAAAACLLFLAALPWIGWESGSRALALSGVVVAMGLFFMSAEIVTGDRVYPRQCAMKQTWCAADNLLHTLGGPVLAATPWLVGGALLLGVSARAVWRLRRD